MLALLPATGAGASIEATPPAHRRAVAPAVQAYPSPGTKAAMPATGITFRGLDPVAADPVRVTGSASGAHGVLGRPHRDRRGITLQPMVAFEPGERVTVRGLAVAGGQGDQFSFTVARPGPRPDPDVVLAADRGTSRAAALQESSPRSVSGPPYKTRPDLRPTAMRITTPASGTEPGVTLTNTYSNTGSGPMVLDAKGQIAWFHSKLTLAIGNLEKARYQGRDVLVWFEGVAPYGRGSARGVWTMVDSTYRRVASIKATNGMEADVHDIHITSNGRAYLMIYNPVLRDLSSVGGSRTANVLELVIQEVDIASGDLLFEWHSLDEFPVTDSVQPLTTDPVDYIHGNSVTVDTDGNLLLSARHLSSVFKINRSTHRVMWRLGGKRNQFTFTPSNDPRPSYQHDALRVGPGLISIFDNGNNRQRSRGVVFRVNETARTATRVEQQHHNPSVFGDAQGGYQKLPGGGSLISWGSAGLITEYDAAGTVRFEMTVFNGAYRAVRTQWSGRPTTLPAVVAQRRVGHDTVFVSWNGATDVASWEVRGGPSRDSLATLATVPRDAFETAINVPHASFVQVRGRTAGGTILGSSAVVPVGPWFSEHDALSAGGGYRPFAGDFAGGPGDDLVFYAPGTARDYLWSAGAGGRFTNSPLPAVNGDYRSLVGNFVGDAHDDILWWAPGRTAAYLWRSDGAGGFANVTVHVPAAVQAKVLAHRSGPDEVLWYNPGTGGDEIAGYRWEVGGAASRHQRVVAVNGNYRPVIGDFDGNGWTDVVWYAAGATPDQYWRLAGNRGGASFGQVQSTVPINGSYSPLAGRFSPSRDTRDDIVWYARGSAADYVWEGTTGARFAESSHTNSATGDPVLLRGTQDHLYLRTPGTSGTIWVPNGRPDLVRSSGNAALGSGHQPIAGDFAATGVSGLLWYAAGSTAERLFLGKLG